MATAVKHRENTPSKNFIREFLALKIPGAEVYIGDEGVPTALSLKRAATQLNEDLPFDDRVYIIEREDRVFLINSKYVYTELATETPAAKTCPYCGHPL